MPANLPPQYKEVEARMHAATDPQEKAALCRELLSLIPKHKGTEKLQKDLKKKMAQLRKEGSGPKAGGRRADIYHVERAGSGQIVLIGGPNAGKSQLLVALTNARAEVAPYPFTTRMPLPGMLFYRKVQIQIVDLPPVSSDHYEGWIGGNARLADVVALVLDLTADPLGEAETCFDLVGRSKLEFVGVATAEQRESQVVVYKPTLILGNKIDVEGAAENWEVIEELYGDRFTCLPLSAVEGEGLDAVQQAFYDALDIIRVYSKVPGKEPSWEKPFTVPTGATVAVFAGQVHRGLADTLKYARVWGASAFDGQRVKTDFVLHDEDVVELHF